MNVITCHLLVHRHWYSVLLEDYFGDCCLSDLLLGLMLVNASLVFIFLLIFKQRPSIIFEFGVVRSSDDIIHSSNDCTNLQKVIEFENPITYDMLS